MSTSLQGITSKTRRDRKHRFRNLYGMLTKRFLMEAWFEINRESASGYDHVSAKEYAVNLRQNIENLVTRLKGKRYRAPLVRRTYIPKANGKTRPLGIPTTEDKLLQKGVARILEAIYEAEFLEGSFGYRKGKGPLDAVQDVTINLQRRKFAYIVDADIKTFFESIDHEWLIRMLEQRIDDKAFIGLIRKWLRAGILLPENLVEHPTTGTPQGGIVSPILANIYLHYTLDLWFEKKVKPGCEGEAYLCSYADDFITAFRYARDAEKFFQALAARLQKFNLRLAEEKTRILKFTRFKKERRARFDFLGFEFTWGVDRKGVDVIKRRTSRKRIRRSLANFKEWCKEMRNCRLRKIFSILNAKLRGYYNYYGVIGNFNSLNEFYTHAMRILYKWLNRRSQRRSFNYTVFNEILRHYRIEKPRITQQRTYQLQLKLS
jgi:RNA-directed DNA polymerase